jgi:hypothetical protein
MTVTDRNVSYHAAVAWRRRDIFAQEQTRVTYEPQEQLVASCRGATLRAKVARHEGNVEKNRMRDEARRETSKRRTFGIRYQPKPEHNNGIRNRRLRQRRQSKEKLAKIDKKTTCQETVKRIARSPVGLQTIKFWTLWRGQPPLKWNEKQETEQEPVM